MTHDPLRRLSKRSSIAILTVVLAIFLWVDNPLFGNPYDIDRSILYSYLPIPLLVYLALVLEKKLNLVSFFLDMLKIVCIKFGITYALAITMWMTFEPPVPILVDVIDFSHKNKQNFLKSRDIQIRNKRRPSHHQVVPIIFGSSLGQGVKKVKLSPGDALRLENREGQLHTAVATNSENTVVFKLPVLPKSKPRWIYIDEPLGLLELRCTVHGPKEPLPFLVIE